MAEKAEMRGGEKRGARSAQRWLSRLARWPAKAAPQAWGWARATVPEPVEVVRVGEGLDELEFDEEALAFGVRRGSPVHQPPLRQPLFRARESVAARPVGHNYFRYYCPYSA
jgi:hypothetical protein